MTDAAESQDILPDATFSFECEGDSSTWQLLRLRAREGLNQLYECRLDLVTDASDIDATALLGKPCVTTITRESHSRKLCGVVRRVVERGTRSNRTIIRITIVPELWTLSQRRDSRIFQDKTVIEIVTSVLQTAAVYTDRVDQQLDATYSPREYCVQYRETDLAFVTRLLESEGISYYFTHDDDAERLVLSDHLSAHPELPTMDGESLRLVNESVNHGSVETIQSFHWGRRMVTTGTVLRQYDFTRPMTVLSRKTPSRDLGPRPNSDSPGDFNLGGYDSGSGLYASDTGASLAEIRQQEVAGFEYGGRGQSDAIALLPGLRFKPQVTPVKEFVLSTVEHRAYNREALPHSTGAPSKSSPEDHYRNDFRFIAADIVFRPARVTPRPSIPGALTATVVGPSSEEIYTDVHGRIKVQFHWDSLGQNDENSSCWMRVMQAWAGPGWGFNFIPRIGMEVVVQFLDGGPDNPVVTGSLYNGRNRPPYELPADKTKSTIKTRSSPGDMGFNELRFEDAAGSEEIFVHAQKDMNEVVLNNHTTTVTVDQTNTVHGNQTEAIDLNQSMSVGGDRTKTVAKDETTTIGHTRSEHVKKDEKITIDGKRTESVKGDESVSVDGERSVAIKKDDTLDASANKHVHVAKKYVIVADELFSVAQKGTTITFTEEHVELDAKKHISMKRDSAEVLVDDDGAITIKTDKKITLQCGKSSITMTDSEMVLKVDQTAITLKPKEMSLESTKVSSSAKDGMESKGSAVKVN